ncbi:MAG: hypothetical protein JWO33_2362 [Caulobacteraceae bacterium]|nr:hypothetical protein [Caulobacteraceae bacterium]
MSDGQPPADNAPKAASPNFLAGWFGGAWIHSHWSGQNQKYWVDRDWVCGPVGAKNVNTGYWIAGGWIYGPVGAEDPRTGFYISEDYIYGPSEVLPFVQ